MANISNFTGFEDIRHICRVCLNKNKILILLNNYLHGTVGNPLISDVLSYVMSTKMEDSHPKGICPRCLDHVKLAHKLKLQFEESQKKLQRYEESIIASYINDDIFEVYESDTFYESESDSRDSFKTLPKTANVEILPYKITVNKDKEDKNCLIHLNGSENIKSTNASLKLEADNFDKNRSLKIIRVKKNDKSRGDTEVCCEDTKDFVKGKHTLKTNISNSHYNLSSNRSNLENINSEYKSNKCPICGNYYSKGKFKSHVLYCKKLKITTLTCKECHKIFKEIKYLNYHMKLKHSSNPPSFPCKICGFVCKSNSAKQVHTRREHGEKTFICEICGKAFFYNAGLLKHKGKHTKETQEVCNICGKSFHYKGALFYHIKMHTNDRKYLCNFCEKTFYTSQALQRHIDTHTGEKRFKCTFCNKSFRSSSERRRHEMIHTGERSHCCNYCNKGFTSKYNHDVHVSTHRGQKPCYICKGSFLNAKVLQLHLKLKHKVQVEELNVKEEMENTDKAFTI